MKRFLVVVLALAFFVVGAARAAEPSAGSKTMVNGYLAPNFRIIDNSGSDAEKTVSDVGFGMAFNRVTFTGEMEAGKVVKNVAWTVEVDVSSRRLAA